MYRQPNFEITNNCSRNRLNLIKFQIFLHENINAVILEVGIGGRFDNTNVITKPVVCGITSLGIG